MKKPGALLCLSFLLSLSFVAVAQTKPKRADLGAESPQSILWVGNSFFYYNNSMHNHVTRLIVAADPKSRPRGVSVTISGSGIDWHDMESYFRPNGIGKYSFTGDNEIVFNPPGRQFDTVIVMDCSQCPIHPRLKSVFHEYARKQSDVVRKHGARPILFMSWAYKDKPEMTAQLAEQYTLAGNDNDALVIPAGLAFANGRRRMTLGAGADWLSYDIYVDAPRTVTWSSTPVSVPAANAATVPFYGRVFAQQDVSVGSYADTVIVTFNF